LERLETGDKEWESDAVKYLLEGDSKIQNAEEDELKLLTEGAGILSLEILSFSYSIAHFEDLSNPWIGADDDEPDTDEIPLDEPLSALDKKDNSKWNQALKKIEDNVKQQQVKFTFSKQ
jgi:hypothetical protein